MYFTHGRKGFWGSRIGRNAKCGKDKEKLIGGEQKSMILLSLPNNKNDDNKLERWT